ncbi:DNA-packaging protein FI [Klebsiella aerogenes]|uniref:DNA-packaging protein FI n=1 Tax=Klebsiella aerogenes TaxID=548 RepID=UPI001F3CAC50|nr:DNA-packaging protein FI [Klebsiella aerogenes]
MNKPELIAALNEVSGKLGRELRTEGSNNELQARLDEALAELKLLEEEGEEEENLRDTDTFGADSAENRNTDDAGLPESGARDDLRQIRLLATMDIFHYQSAKSRKDPALMQKLRSIISPGEVILVTDEEAELQISLGRAELA